MINKINKKVLRKISANERGLSISDLVRSAVASRGQIRISIAFLLGSGEIIERKTGMTKLYFRREE